MYVCFAMRTCAHAQRIRIYRDRPPTGNCVRTAHATARVRPIYALPRVAEIRNQKFFAVEISVPQEATVEEMLGGVLNCWNGTKIEGGR